MPRKPSKKARKSVLKTRKSPEPVARKRAHARPDSWTDALVNFDGRWIRLSAIEAILPQDVLGFASKTETKVLHSNGSYVQFKDKTPDDLIEILGKTKAAKQ